MAVKVRPGRDPMRINCPGCNAAVFSGTNIAPGVMTWVCCWLLNPLCCCVPFCIDDCKDTEHYCPNCNNYLGKYRAP